MMIAVKLYGHLGKRFGRVHRFDIATPAEAIQALRANFREFAQHVLEHNAPGYRIVTDRGEQSAEQILDPMGGQSIKIIPYVAGAANGVGQFIIGAHLLAAGLVLTATGNPISGSIVANIGIAMMIGGASQFLFRPPEIPGPPNRPENNPSYSFNGPVNTTVQGNPVSICYGRLRVGSQVISGGMYATAI